VFSQVIPASDDYARLITSLVRLRKAAAFSQVALAEKLGNPQPTSQTRNGGSDV
jgi:hypothetical protein